MGRERLAIGWGRGAHALPLTRALHVLSYHSCTRPAAPLLRHFHLRKSIPRSAPAPLTLASVAPFSFPQILRRINDEIEARRRDGQPLPPPPKTAIAGPEYFGLNQPEVVAAIEAMDPEGKHQQYW